MMNNIIEEIFTEKVNNTIMNKGTKIGKRIISLRFERQYKSLHLIGIHFQKAEALLPERRAVLSPIYTLVIDLWSHRLELLTRKDK